MAGGLRMDLCPITEPSHRFRPGLLFGEPCRHELLDPGAEELAAQGEDRVLHRLRPAELALAEILAAAGDRRAVA